MLTADLSGKAALVTGASSGFGLHFARVLARAGAHVVVAARRAASLDALVAHIHASGGNATAVLLDVNDSRMIDEAVKAAGKIDILVNNAGVTCTKPVLEQTESDYDSIVGTNLKGAFLVACAVARRMRESGNGGSIINIASILGIRQGGQLATYAISKAGIIQMTKQLALELARDNIRVNALVPGYFATELNGDFFATDAGEALIRRIPQRRLGQVEDLDGPLLLLASDASRFMTGSIISVDGGHLTSSL